MTNIEIKPVETAQVELLQQLSRLTFSETFSELNTPENMTRYLEEELSLEKLRLELSNPDSRFYFALDHDEPIGYLKLNFGDAQTEVKDGHAMEIERIYVLRAYQGKRLGQVLYEKAVEIALQNGLQYIWLGVWEHNIKAIRFYKKQGFVEFDQHVFMLGSDKQTDIMMKLELK